MSALAARGPAIAGAPPVLSDAALARLTEVVHARFGLQLGPTRRALVEGRLGKRVVALGLDSLDAYVERLCSGRDPAEWRQAEALLTTNETHFFREPLHFEVLARHLRRRTCSSPVRIWSAACSSGEEVYTLGMVLEDLRREGRIPEWEVLGTDLSPRVLERAVSGSYPVERASEIPDALLRRYCLRGSGPDQGTLLVDRVLRERCSFAKVNLTLALPDVGRFDVVFLRNVLIYFDVANKRQVVTALFAHLRPGGLLFTGLAESLHGVCDARRMDAPGVYRPAGGSEPPVD